MTDSSGLQRYHSGSLGAPRSKMPIPPQRAFSIVAIVLVAALIFSGVAPIRDIAENYPFEILLIYLALDVLARLILQTGAIERFAIGIALETRGSMYWTTLGVGIMVFLLSAFLNNLATIFIVAPLVISIMTAARMSRKAVQLLFALMISMSNLGGASTPIGDFPAITIMSEGLAGFLDYLVWAFPLFLMNAVLIMTSFAVITRSSQDPKSIGQAEASAGLSVKLAMMEIRHKPVDWGSLAMLGVIFGGMVVVWATVPSTMWPFWATAFAGMIIALTFSRPSNVRQALSDSRIDALLIMGAFLGIAAVASATNVVDTWADWLSTLGGTPLVLLFTMMAVTCLASAVFSAGPAAAAMLPLVSTLSAGALREHDTMLAVGFAAAICAGSSCFMWSATAGPALSQIATDHAEDADAEMAQHLRWSIREYGWKGPALCAAQLVFAYAWIAGWYLFAESEWMTATIFVGGMTAGAILSLIGRGFLLPQDVSSEKSDRFQFWASWAGIVSAVCSIIGFVYYVANL